MPLANLAPGDSRARAPLSGGGSALPAEAHASAVSWGAVFAGAAGAAALSLILLILGTGLGMSTVSPWANQGAGATTIGTASIVWITLTQLLAAGSAAISPGGCARNGPRSTPMRSISATPPTAFSPGRSRRW